MESTDKQHKKQHKSPWLKEYEWKPGESGNEKGRPKGKTLKEWAKEFLMSLPDDTKLEFLREIDPDIVWKMAEGNPQNSDNVNISGTLSLKELSRSAKELEDNKDETK